MTNLEKYNKIFIELFGVDEADLNQTLTFESKNEWDSLGHVTLIEELENVFDVFFESEDMLNFGSYENGKKILLSYGIDMSENYES